MDTEVDERPDQLADVSNYDDSSYANSGIDQLESFANDPKNHQDVVAAEKEPSQGGWRVKDDGQNNNKEKVQGSGGKKGGLITTLVLTAAFGGMTTLIPLNGPFFMSGMLGKNNDAAGSVSSQRGLRTLFRLMAGNSTGGPGSDGELCSAKKVSCKLGRISNKALHNLNKVGVTALDASGKPIEFKRNGYPKKNPSSYRIADTGKVISNQEIMNHLKTNPKQGAKVFGRRGVMGMRVKAKVGKFKVVNFLQKFGLFRDGGVTKETVKADKKLDKKARREARKKRMGDFMKKRIPGVEKLTAVQNRLVEKVTKKGVRAKANTTYLAAYAVCLASKAGHVITAGAAAYQIAQLLPLIQDFVLSPGTKNAVSGTYPKFGLQPESMEDLMDTLTEKDENGKSAMDSKALQAAMGINREKLDLEKYKEFIPGYAVSQLAGIKALNAVDSVIGPLCNVVMSPAAMYVFIALNVALSANPFVALAGVAVGFAISAGLQPLMQKIMEMAAQFGLEKIANMNLPEQKGEKLGDALGMAALAYYSSDGIANLMPTLTESQRESSQKIYRADEEMQRELDIASLSPLDVSSPHTFLGSIAYSFFGNTVRAGTYNPSNSLGTIFNSLFMIPGLSLSNNAMAAGTSNLHNYAAAFGRDNGNPDETPCLNAAGMPCIGITEDMNELGSEEAENILINAKWLKADADVEIPDEANIYDLLEESGNDYWIIRKGTPLSDYIQECGDASTGEYMIQGAGCSIPGGLSGTGIDKDNPYGDKLKYCDEETEDSNCPNDGELSSASTSQGSSGIYFADEPNLNDKKSGTLVDSSNSEETEALKAGMIWVIDYITTMSIQGFDDEDGTEGAANGEASNGGEQNPDSGGGGQSGGGGSGSGGGSGGGETSPSSGWTGPLKTMRPTSYYGMRKHPVTGVYKLHDGDDYGAACGTPIYAANAGTVTVTNPSWAGTLVTINHGGGIQTQYGHMNGASVKSGDKVSASQQIAKVGTAGTSTGCHLHFMVRVNGKTTAPSTFLKSKGVGS